MMDVVEALKSENESLKSVIETINAEKMALDQTALGFIKENISLRTQLVLLQYKLNKIEEKNNVPSEVSTVTEKSLNVA